MTKTHQPETDNFINSSVYLDLLSPFKEKIKSDLISMGLDYMSSPIQVVEYMLRGWSMYAESAPSLDVRGLVLDYPLSDQTCDYSILLRKVDIDKYGQSFVGLVKNTSLGTYEYLGIESSH
jgi:hypothetical protein